MHAKPTSMSREDNAPATLAVAARVFAEKPFVPHPLFRSGHAQTLIAYAWPRRHRLRNATDKGRLFEVAPGVAVLALCRWHTDRQNRPTLVLWLGIEGSVDSVYMQATAQKGFLSGFNIVRVNLRNCGGTEHLTPTLYHGGLSGDLRAIVKELIEHDGLSRIFLICFSLGGNLVLKVSGEYGDAPPPELTAICAVSPSVNLSASADAIARRSNWLYHQDFLRRLRRRIYLKKRLYPELYDLTKIDLVRTIRDFDEHFTSATHGFVNADDYYSQASSIRVVAKIRIPTLIIHAQDDPFIPFAPLTDLAFSSNPSILLLAPERGGHVAFVAAKSSAAKLRPNGPLPPAASQPQKVQSDSLVYDDRLEDRFWAENRAVEFCLLAK
jgi:predicted alpha/beta-fold hydrolase